MKTTKILKIYNGQASWWASTWSDLVSSKMICWRGHTKHIT